MSNCGKSGCKEEPLAADEEERVSFFLYLSSFFHSPYLFPTKGLKSIFTPYSRYNLDLDLFFRQLGVPSVARLTRILIRLFTSRGAQKKKALTSHSCQKRWNGC